MDKKDTPKSDKIYYFEEHQKLFDAFDNWIKAITKRFNRTANELWSLPISAYYSLIDCLLDESEQAKR